MEPQALAMAEGARRRKLFFRGRTGVKETGDGL